MVKMLSKKCTMERRTSSVHTPHHCSAVKETGVYRERIVPETAVRHTNNRAMRHTLMLETVSIVWKVGSPELGETVKDAGHGVHYDAENLYPLSSSLKHRKEPLCVPRREWNLGILVMAGRCVNNREMCGTMMVEIVPVVWKVECPELGAWRRCWAQSALWYGEPILSVILIIVAQEKNPYACANRRGIP